MDIMYEKITLSNGVRIIYEYIPHVRSVTMGIWVGTGSRFENAQENGASHFIEHMLFKGTTRRSAADIAWESDRIGGQINAFTTRECTCFYGRVLDDHLNVLTDLLCDMFFNPRFSPKDVENERSVIFEEIDMYEDAPDDLVSERLFAGVFKGSSLARPVLGSKKTLSAMSSESLRGYMQGHYDASSVVVAVSGSFRPSDIDRIKRCFSYLESRGNNTIKAARYRPALVTKKKNIEQNHLCLGFPGIGINSEKRFAFQLMSSILGGSMSSRLFQTVREKNGLCYGIYSFTGSYSKEGLFSVYTALNREMESRAIRLILSEIERFIEHGVTEDELSCAQEQARTNILMGLESTSTRMNRLARGELFSGGVLSVDELCLHYDSVTREQIRTIAEEHLSPDGLSLSAVGKAVNADSYRELLGEYIK